MVFGSAAKHPDHCDREYVSASAAPRAGGKLTLREADRLATVSNLEGGRATISFLPGAAEA